MTARMEAIARELVELQWRRRVLGWSLKAGLVAFEQGIVAEHRRLKQSFGRYLADASVASMLTFPVIYSMIIPIGLIDFGSRFTRQSAFAPIVFLA